MGWFGSSKKGMSQAEFDAKMKEMDARDKARGPEVSGRGTAAAADFSTGNAPKPTVTNNASEPSSGALKNIDDYATGQKSILQKRMKDAGAD